VVAASMSFSPSAASVVTSCWNSESVTVLSVGGQKQKDSTALVLH
jgi:hypothetical protein